MAALKFVNNRILCFTYLKGNKRIIKVFSVRIVKEKTLGGYFICPDKN